MPGVLCRTLIVLNCKKETKKQVFETRRKELKSIFKTFQDISKQERERSQNLWKSHKKFFEEEPQPEPETEIVVIKEDDDFFKK